MILSYLSDKASNTQSNAPKHIVNTYKDVSNLYNHLIKEKFSSFSGYTIHNFN